ncbi:response regulator [Candidatus Neomarinimicrobiota bacterium]
MKRLYIEALHARIDALEAAKKALGSGELEAEDSIRRLAHTIRGSGTTYGFPEITTAAGKVEDAERENLAAALEELLANLYTVAAQDESKLSGVLIVEDNPIESRILQARLAAKNRNIFAAETAAQAEEILQQEDISLILLDLILPDTDGRNFLIKLKERPELAGIPVFVVSAKGSPGTKAECFALGAESYFEKPVDPEILTTAVAAKIQSSGETVSKSRTDPLTGLPNRAAFTEEFNRARSMAGRSRTSLAVAIIDLDHFKNLNDTYGHRMGDEVLKRIRPVMSKALRQSDYVARWGGEEFVVLFPKADAKGAAGALNKALGILRKEQFSIGGLTISDVTFSGGVQEISSDVSVDEAIAEADHHLYQAKENGRAQIVTPATEITAAKKTILLAEDDELVTSVIKHRLGREGFEVIHFPDGISAFKAALDMTASLAILDVKMPGMDGFELLDKLRKMTHYRTIPIVMLTSMGSEQDIVRGLELGADDYIMKPFSPVELLARIRRLLKEPSKANKSSEDLKVLLVDDDPVILMTVAKSLEASEGFQIIQAQSIRQAMDLIRQELPGVVLTDLILAEEDGTTILQNMLADESLKTIPVVFLTAKTDPAIADDLVKKGASGVLWKPINPKLIGKQLKDILGK